MPFYHGLKAYRDRPGPGDYTDKSKWIAERLLALRYDLGEKIVNDRRPGSLIIGSWNIRAFDGGLPRLDESMHYIAEIMGAFDICAVQEVKSDLGPVKRLKDLLGPNWDYFVTDASDHEGGNNERMAFFFDTNKVIFRNLIGEIVVRSDTLSTGGQIARSPFFAAFQAGWFRFTLCSTHIVFGETNAAGLQRRAEEIKAVAKALKKRGKKEDQVYILLGDMNIDSRDGVVMRALEDSGLEVPDFPPTNMGGDKYYDQIAFSTEGKVERKTRLIRFGAFDWRRAVFGPLPDPDPTAPDDPSYVKRISHAESLAHYEPVVQDHRGRHPDYEPYADFSRSYKRWTTEEMSDHLPIWVELETDYSDDYLMRFVGGP